MAKNQKKNTLELDIYEIERFAEYLNYAGFEVEQIASRYEFDKNPISKVFANGLRSATSFLPKIYLKLVRNKTYQQTNVISTKLTEAEITALKCVIGVLQIENAAINNTNEVRQLMMHLQF